ncbi:nitrogen metabolic regulation nmr [Fusarium subglutinans]|uniref:Nitrogen metabolic regulation nmr n=1 Tax=Gibberella subglutinans TaxID=42677 RepID=A0A8H5P2K3_GIBSU|nr:nitrogen metabolic regulation nmr [Fusarium subglutinans]KAF5588546.1 nitrogen metabolic regulation nmr [Fusarium subglutinans]
MSKILTVFGATGNQGGSVVRAILNDPALSKEFKIRGITRDVSKPAAQALASKGVEVVAADMNTAEQVAPAVKDAHTVFLVTNYWETNSGNGEIAQGKAVADACKTAGVKQLVFSSLIDTKKISNGRLTHIKHFEGKAEIEEYIRQINVPATFVLPGFFASNLFTSIRKNEDGSYGWALPANGDKAKVPLFDVNADMGKFVKAAIKNFPGTLNKRIFAATDYYSPNRIISEFSEVIGKPATFNQVPADVFESFLPAPIAKELTENMMLLEEPGYYGDADLKESLDLLDEKPVTWKEFVEQNRSKWE